MHNVSGMHGAAPVWLDLMRALHASDAPPAPPAAPGLVRATVRFADDVEAAREEWFIAGTERSQVALAEPAQGLPRILTPVDGTVLALDPDIPAARQRIAWTAEGGAGRLAWRLNGQRVAQGRRFDWPPQAGRHVIELVAGAQAPAVVDRVDIEVRGGGPRANALRALPGSSRSGD